MTLGNGSAPNNRYISILPGATALTIAGSDPSGGAGLQADLKTFQQLGVYGMSVVTLITVQNTQSVRHVEVLSPELIASQFEAVIEDIPPRAVKTGALGNSNVVQAVAEKLADLDCPIIVDPVMVSKHGDALVDEDVIRAYKQYLLPHTYLVTPNRFEAEQLTGLTLDSEQAAAKAIHQLHSLGARYVLIKLGEIKGQSQHVLGLGAENKGLHTVHLNNNNTHGTGCILSAAIAAKLALGETNIETAVLFGIHRTHEAIYTNTGLGHGIHPAEIRGMLRD